MIGHQFSVFVMEMNIAHFQAMLKRDIDEETRSIVERLLAEAEHHLALAKQTAVRT